MRRERSKSQPSAVRHATWFEDEYLAIALQRLCDKLRAAQPVYHDEDVAVIPFPAEGGNSPPAHSSPSRPPGTGLLDAFTLAADEERSANNEGHSPTRRAASLGRSNNGLDKSNAAQGSNTAASSFATDGALSSSLFLTAVNLFDAKLLVRSKRVAMEAVRLIEQGCSLVLQDTMNMTEEDHTGQALANGAVTPPRCLQRSHSSPPPSSSSASRVRRPLFTSRSRSPTPLPPSPRPARTARRGPDPQLVRRLDACLQSLLVYANNSAWLRLHLTSNEALLQRFGSLGYAARRLERGEQNKAVQEDGITERNVQHELDLLTQRWTSAGLVAPLVRCLRECYLVDFLLDAALPPAVCSSRYDGLLSALYEKKQKVVLDMLSSKQGLATMLHRLPLRSVCALVTMSSYMDPKLRVRLLDKMASEGLVERLLRETCRALDELTDAPHNENEEEEEEEVICDELDRAMPMGSAERLGFCMDVLLVLSSPNLRPAAETDAMLRQPRTAATAVVRATVWASHESALYELTLRLLWLVCEASDKQQQLTWRRGSVLGALQTQANECVAQLAAHSGGLYAVVVRVLDTLMCEDDMSSCSALRLRGDLGGVLPLVLHMLAQDAYARANTASIRGWFARLTARLLPDVFEVPAVTSSRRSTAEWGRRRRANQQQRTATSEKENEQQQGDECNDAVPVAGVSNVPRRRQTPRWTLARELRRDEVHLLAPYFRFACRLVQETTWRMGIHDFLSKLVFLAYQVLRGNGRRDNMSFGQAITCFDLVTPILEHGLCLTPTPPASPQPAGPSTTLQLPAPNTLMSDDGRETPSRPARKRSRSSVGVDDDDNKAATECVPGDTTEDVQARVTLQPFIDSPSPSSPSFRAACSPDATSEATMANASVTPPPCLSTIEGDEDAAVGEASPAEVTRSWRQRLSLRGLLFVTGTAQPATTTDDGRH